MERAYIYDDMEHFTDSDLAMAYTKVTPSRRDKARTYLKLIDRKQSVIAELLLRHALRHACGITELPGLSEGRNGKPQFAGGSLPEFNLSHCTLAVACAVSDSPVGIDVEPYSSYNEEVAREVFSPRELEGVLGSPSSFAGLWTMKESYLKFTGRGLTDHLPSLLEEGVEAGFHTFHKSLPGYACTLCSRAADFPKPIFVDKTTLLDG